MAYADTGRSATATLETLCTLIEGIFGSTYDLTWTAGPTPTYGGLASLTFTSVTTTYSKYIRVGKLVIWMLSCTGTTGGTDGNTLTATTPIVPKTGQTAFGGCFVYIGAGSPRGGNYYLENGVLNCGPTLIINYGLGAGRGMHGVFIYEAN
jgi:hypothetical protein